MPTILSLFLLAADVNIRKKYCKDYAGTNKKGDYFVGNLPGNYPHLHCGKTFLTLSEVDGKHTSYESGPCNKIIKTFQDKQHILSVNKEITDVLQAYFKDNCQKHTLPTVDVNIREKYCKDYASETKDKDYFVGNPESRYPHLHCGKTFLTLKMKGKKNTELEGNCEKIQEVYKDKDLRTAGEPDKIATVLEKYFRDICPSQKLPKSFVSKPVKKSGR